GREQAGDGEGIADVGVTGGEDVREHRPLRETADEDLAAVRDRGDAAPDVLLGVEDVLGHILRGGVGSPIEPGIAAAIWNEPLRELDLDLYRELRPRPFEAVGAAAAAVEPDEERRGRIGALGKHMDEVDVAGFDRGRLLAAEEENEDRGPAPPGSNWPLKYARADSMTASEPACGSKPTSTSGRIPLPSSGDPSGKSSRHDGR